MIGHTLYNLQRDHTTQIRKLNTTFQIKTCINLIQTSINRFQNSNIPTNTSQHLQILITISRIHTCINLIRISIIQIRPLNTPTNTTLLLQAFQILTSINLIQTSITRLHRFNTPMNTIQLIQHLRFRKLIQIFGVKHVNVQILDVQDLIDNHHAFVGPDHANQAYGDTIMAVMVSYIRLL